MIELTRVESLRIVSVWMLEPQVPRLLMELGKRGYVTARVVPKPLAGYEITVLEPATPGADMLIAIKGSTYVFYNRVRRSLAVEGPKASDVVRILEEVEQVLESVGSSPARGVLFYELLAKGIAKGDRLVLTKKVRLRQTLDVELDIVPTTLTLSTGDPNSTYWLHLEIKPHWTSWPEDTVYYELNLVYRDNRKKLVHIATEVEALLKELLLRLQEALREHRSLEG